MIITLLPYFIKKIDESGSPLSCHCFVIKGNDSYWIFDVGACDRAAEEINGIDGKKNIILSHFHQDHTANLGRINADNVYQGAFTFKHTKTGTVIDESIVFEDGYSFRIFPLPNTHAKGSLAMEVNGYLFIGDAFWPAPKGSNYCYNATMLRDEIDTLKASDAKYFIHSHGTDFIKPKEEIIDRLERIYSERNPKEAFITVR